MKIGIIDADLIDSNTKFPNLALMKISSYWKSKGHESELINWENVEQYDKVFVSKVFDYSNAPEDILNMSHVNYGGTGFFFDKAKPLPDFVEHAMPDYELYSDVDKKLKYYHIASIGFTTRGCVRKCVWCVNRNSTKVVSWSHIDEFFDDRKKIISLWDDNILAYKYREAIIESVINKNRPYEYKQGMDLRLTTPEIRDLIMSSKYHGDYIFAFDDWEFRYSINNKLSEWLEPTNKKNTKLFLLVGFKSVDVTDIVDVFKRIRVLMYYKCLPYIMRYKGWDNGDMRGIYINLARWCNQVSFFKKLSFREFVEKHDEKSATVRYMREFEQKYPKIASEFFDLKYGEVDKLYL